MSKINMQRLSRTDKGVHAAVNLVACTLQFQEKDMVSGVKFKDYENKKELKFMLDRNKCIQQMNEKAPPELRFHGRDGIIAGLRYLSDSFNPKFDASMREYEYLLPLHVMIADILNFNKDSHYARTTEIALSSEVNRTLVRTLKNGEKNSRSGSKNTLVLTISTILQLNLSQQWLKIRDTFKACQWTHSLLEIIALTQLSLKIFSSK